MRIRVALEIVRQFSTLDQHCGFELSALYGNVQTHVTNRFPLDSLEKDPMTATKTCDRQDIDSA